MQISSVFGNQAENGNGDMGSTIMSVPSLEGWNRCKIPDLSGIPPVFAQYSTEGRCFKIRLADKAGTRRQAGMLINRRYSQRGYGEQEFNDEPHRLTIVAYDGDMPVGTLTLSLDGPAGLLCDELYGMEVDLLRIRGRRVCEIVKLAADASSARLHTMAALFHVAFVHAYHIHGFDDAVMEVNPRHANFYKNRLGFKMLGSSRLNLRVNAPAVLMHCKLTDMNMKIKLHGGCVDARTHERTIYPYFFNSEDANGILQRLSILASKIANK